jgi:hypothetical protein
LVQASLTPENGVMIPRSCLTTAHDLTAVVEVIRTDVAEVYHLSVVPERAGR